MAYLEIGPRVGRSQGGSIFWGVVSAFFAAAACFYYWQNHENEAKANLMRDQVLELSEQNETLTSQKEHLQADAAEAESQLKTREDLVQAKETELAEEETQLDALGQQSQDDSTQNQAQAAVVKKFNDLIHTLPGDTPPDVVERGGRPVLRLPSTELFALGDAALLPAGKALLNQIARALNDQLDHFELRIVCYTDTAAEPLPAAPAKPDPAGNPNTKPVYATSWDLTSARAATIARFFRDQTSLPFLNVLVIGRGDAEPISSNAGANHARNRRVEITVTPLPVPFHAPDLDHPKTDAHPSAATGGTAPDVPAASSPAKPKEKKADKPGASPH